MRARWSLLASDRRSAFQNARLGVLLAFVAGAVNAGGFFAVGVYTSHMTGIVSGIADNAVIGASSMVLSGVCFVAAFVIGAATTTLLIKWGHQQLQRSVYALPLFVEGMVIASVGAFDVSLPNNLAVKILAITLLLCFLMGMQNAIITKISRAEIRTTHMTGILTDIGISIGRLLWSSNHHQVEENALSRLKILAAVFFSFVTGGFVGALGFKYAGLWIMVPLGVLVMLPSVPQFARDVARRRRRNR